MVTKVIVCEMGGLSTTLVSISQEGEIPKYSLLYYLTFLFTSFSLLFYYSRSWNLEHLCIIPFTIHILKGKCYWATKEYYCSIPQLLANFLQDLCVSEWAWNRSITKFNDLYKTSFNPILALICAAIFENQHIQK